MKHFLLSIGLLLLGAWGPQRARAQAPAWQSARAVATATALASNNYSDVTAPAVDAAGNVFLIGTFSNTVVLGGTTLTSAGGDDVFVAKFNPVSNQFVWAQRAGGPNFEFATALVVSGTSVYVAGYFQAPTASFGAITLTSTGFIDAFVAKLTDAGSTGSFVWAQQVRGANDETAFALAVSGPSVYVTGYFSSPTASIGTTTLTNAGTLGARDVYVAKLTDAGSTGSFAWAQRAGGSNSDESTALAVSGTSVYVAGYFTSGTAGFGSTTLTNAGSDDLFVAKLTDAGSTGSFTWAQRAGGTSGEQARALAVSGNSVYVAGDFLSPTVGFGATTLTNAGPGDYDMFVAKLTDAGSTGNFVWAQRAGGTSGEQARALAVSGNSVYVAGDFLSLTVGFGATTLTNSNSSPVSTDVFVAKLTDAGGTGSFAWAQRAGGTGNDNARTVVVSGTSVHVAGSFYERTTAFGTIILTNPFPNFRALGFLASLTDPTLTATTAGRALAPASLFPNPARHTVALRLPAGTGPAPLTLTDAQGRTVRRYPAPAGPEAALDLGGLPAGLYLLRGAGPALRLAVE